ncbi:palmitoyl-protein thioesterase 1 [Pelomyxa schiedti]|nr:palmitoyl-protein thioesterase 1 [Pelomyxa schiedti]
MRMRLGLVLVGVVLGCEYRPTVLWHGMGDSCCDPLSLGKIQREIESALPGIYVYSIEIGESTIEDMMNSFFMNSNDQIDTVCALLKNDTRLQNGFNAVGFSQGGQFLRAYVERCNDPPVFNLVTLGGQHQGVFGYPGCPMDYDPKVCELLRRLMDLGAYLPFVQEHLAQANYWHDPYLDLYIDGCTFLPYINNEPSLASNPNAQQNKEHMLTLNNFVMVLFENDSVVIPRESEWFGFYANGEDSEVIPLRETDLYIEDWLGLQTLDKEGKLIELSTEGDHLDFTLEWFDDTIIYPYLNNTLPC